MVNIRVHDNGIVAFSCANLNDDLDMLAQTLVGIIGAYKAISKHNEFMGETFKGILSTEMEDLLDNPAEFIDKRIKELMQENAEKMPDFDEILSNIHTLEEMLKKMQEDKNK